MCGVVSKELDGSTFKVAYEGLKLLFKILPNVREIIFR
jgi:hypothetical protein